MEWTLYPQDSSLTGYALATCNGMVHNIRRNSKLAKLENVCAFYVNSIHVQCNVSSYTLNAYLLT